MTPYPPTASASFGRPPLNGHADPSVPQTKMRKKGSGPMSDTPASADCLDVVLRYHQRTKHHIGHYARSLGFTDWANPPDPFRRFEGAPLLRLVRPVDDPGPTYMTR